MTISCEDCNRPYGEEHGFPDFIIPFEAWRQISTGGDDTGLLCPSCICKRLHDKGIRCEGAFMSGPIDSVSSVTMNNLRRVENIELAINGRDNGLAGIRRLAIPFKVGDRVRHVSRGERGTVTIVANGRCQVEFDNPTPCGNRSVGEYDANWFLTYPAGLVREPEAPPQS